MKKIPNKVPSAQNAQSRKKRHWKQFVTTVSCLVVFCTVYALILPAVTLDKNKVYCDQEVHVHTDDCYQIVADQAEPPAEDNLEFNPEFTGDPETLTDGTPIGETAQADEGFMDAAPVEENAEVSPQTAEEEQPVTTPQEPSVRKELICQIPEHEHSRQCESNPEEVETREDWIKTIPEEKDLKEDLKERVLQIAESQLGYKESEKNFQVNEDGSENGFTRYGAWLGEPYTDWNNAFVGWVLNYSRADVPFEKDLAKWDEDLGDSLIQEPQPGMVAFFRDEAANLRTGFFKKIELKDKEAETDESKTNSEEDQETILLIEGDQNGEVKESSVKKDQILAYLNLEKEKPGSDKSNLGSQDEQDAVTDIDDSTGASTENQNSTAGSGLNSETQTNVTDSSSESSAENESEKSEKPSVENTDEKTVEVTGQDTAEVGQVVTLTANTEGFVTEENLVYQWQFKVEEGSWQNLENGNNKTIEIHVDEENYNWKYRVGVRENQSPVSGAPAGAYWKLTPKLKGKIRIPTVKEEDPLLENGEYGSMGDEFFQDYDAVSDPVSLSDETSYAGEASNNQYSSKVELIKGWTQPHSSITEVTVNIKNKTDSSVVGSVTLSESNNWKTTWTMPAEDSNPDHYEFSEDCPSGWKGMLSSFDISTDEIVYQDKLSAKTSIQHDTKYLITNRDGDSCLVYENGLLRTERIPSDLSLISSMWYWTGYSSSGSTYLKSNDGKFLRLYDDGKYSLFVDSYGCPVSYSDDTIRYKDSNKIKSYLKFENGQFSASSQEPKDALTTKLYVLEKSKTYKKKRNILITNTPNYGGTQNSGEDDPLAYGFPISKNIDYLGDKVENTDSLATTNLENTYRLYLSAGPIAGDAAATPINVLYILDRSASMKGTAYSNAKTAISDSWKNLKDNNKDSMASVVTFGTSSNVSQDWTSESSINIPDSAYSYGNGGTNYESALHTAQKQIAEISKKNSYPIFVLFLTDGQATYAGVDCSANNKRACTGNGTASSKSDEKVIEATQTAIGRFRINNPDVNVSVIGYNMSDGLSDPYKYAQMLATGNQIYNSSTAEINDQMIAIIAGPTIKNGEIRDKLSDNVQFADLANPKLVAVDKLNKTQQQLLPEDPENPFKLISLNNKEEGYSEVFAGVDGNPIKIDPVAKTIKVIFGPDWSMNTRYEYVLSFDIEVPETTYTTYLGKGYPDIGDESTDYSLTSNNTSSNKRGFYSNVDNSDDTAFAFTYNKKEYARPYSRPVVQVQQKLTVHKIDSVDPNKSLPGAEFSLQPTNPAGDSVTQITDDEGNAVFTGISDGTYTLREVNPPIGYNASTTTWEIKVENGKFTVNDREPENGSVKSDSGLYIAYKTNITNTAGKPLPNTGGPGNNFYTSTGIALLAAGLFVYRYKNRFSGSERGSK